jgi:hypothetical protein
VVVLVFVVVLVIDFVIVVVIDFVIVLVIDFVIVVVIDFVIVVVFVLAALRQISTCHLDAVSLFSVAEVYMSDLDPAPFMRPIDGFAEVVRTTRGASGPLVPNHGSGGLYRGHPTCGER